MDKNLDYKGRWRNKTVAFRVSEEEAKLIDTQVALSGLTKQDYIIFSSANALIFGIVPGILLAWIAETVGVAISFVLLRFLFRDAAEGVIQKHASLQKIDELSGESGFKVMLIARLVPYLPSGLLNALGAISKMTFKAFVLSALIGKLPSTAIEAMIGHDAVTASES